METVKESIKDKLQRLATEFRAKIDSGEIKTYGDNGHGFKVVVKAGTKLRLKKDPCITAVAAEDCCLVARIKYTSACVERNFKKGDFETMQTYTLLNIFDIL